MSDPLTPGESPRRVPEAFTVGNDRYNAQKAWLDGYDAALASLRDDLAEDPPGERSDRARQLLWLTTDHPAVIAVMGSHPDCAAKGCQKRRAALASTPQEPIEIEHFWMAVKRGWDIEPRQYFEDHATEMGFKSAIEMAVHFMWKRELKERPTPEIGHRWDTAAGDYVPTSTKGADHYDCPRA